MEEPDGTIRVIGVKYTTARAVSSEAVDRPQDRADIAAVLGCAESNTHRAHSNAIDKLRKRVACSH